MLQTTKEFARVAEHPFDWLAKTKERTGKKIIGSFPLYVPHELVEAAGMIPVDIYGGSGEMTAAASHLQSITCYPVRSAVELLLTGSLKALDGAIFTAVCTGATSGGEVWRSLSPLPFYHQYIVPQKSPNERSKAYHTYQIQRLRAALEAFGGQTITDEGLANTIRLYNGTRAVLAAVAQASKEKPDVLPPQEFAMVRASASFMPRAEYQALLEQLRAELDAAPSNGPRDRVPLVLVGNLCDLPQYPVLAAIDEAGGAVVEDDSPLGRRRWEAVPEGGDPVMALARHYAESSPCPTKLEALPDANYAYLLDLVRSSRAAGVVFLRPLYCDPAGIDYTLLSQRLNAANIPTLSLDVNGREATSGQVQTRLQAFIEMLRR